MTQIFSDGKYEYYVIQYKKLGETEWGKPDLALIPYNIDWNDANWDWIINILDIDLKLERYNVWSRLRINGFSTIENAIRACQNCIRASEEGRLDICVDGVKMSRVRYDFRVVKITIEKKSEVVPFPTVGSDVIIKESTEKTLTYQGKEDVAKTI